MEDVELEFRDDALNAIAKKAMDRKTGARGLRSIVEAVLLDTMYDLPSMENVSKVVIDETVIRGESKPILIYDSNEKKAASEQTLIYKKEKVLRGLFCFYSSQKFKALFGYSYLRIIEVKLLRMSDI